MSYKLETTALISKENYNAFRIRCIMLILGKLNFEYGRSKADYLISVTVNDLSFESSIIPSLPLVWIETPFSPSKRIPLPAGTSFKE